jgi:hypothetical protein
MGAVQIALIVAAGAIAGFVLLSLLMRVLVSRVTAAGQRRIDERFEPSAIVRADPAANFFGLTSRGPMQNRGNGALVLTATTLHFLPLVGDELAIERADIKAVVTAKSHLGKTIGRSLLKVEFGDDSIAWLVTDLTGWLAALDAGAQRHSS